MKIKDFLDVLLTDKAIKVNGEIVTKMYNSAFDDFSKYEDKEVIGIRIHHNCVELEVA